MDWRPGCILIRTPVGPKPSVPGRRLVETRVTVYQHCTLIITRQKTYDDGRIYLEKLSAFSSLFGTCSFVVVRYRNTAKAPAVGIGLGTAYCCGGAFQHGRVGRLVERRTAGALATTIQPLVSFAGTPIGRSRTVANDGRATQPSSETVPRRSGAWRPIYKISYDLS